MAVIDPASLSGVDRYRLAIGTIVPRPIAWITTVDAKGLVNLAPFSFFNGVTASPFIVSVGIAHRDPIKDTLRNLRSSGEAVVHLIPPALLEVAHRSGAEYAPDISEAVELGLPMVPAQVVRPPRLSAAEVAFECRLHREIPVGDPPLALCLLEVIRVHVAESIATPDGFPDPTRLRTAARLGGAWYVRGDTWDLVELQRQKAPEGKGIRR